MTRYATTLDGVRIGYAVRGTGWPVVWTAQPPASNFRLVWKERPLIFQPFADRFQFITYDARGTGSSERESLVFSLEAMLEDLDAVVRATEVSRFALVAAGQASMIALHYAARCPQRVSQLVFIDGYSSALDLTGSASFALALTLKDDDWTGLSDTFITLMLSPEARYVVSSVTPEAYRAILAAYYEQDSWNATAVLGSLATPALVVQTRDLPYAGRLASELGAQLVTIDDPNYLNLAPLVEAFVGQRAFTPRNDAQFPSTSVRSLSVPTSNGLSPREREVLALIATGKTNAQIAEALVIAEATAARHIHNILSKLGMHRRSEAAAWWAADGNGRRR